MSSKPNRRAAKRARPAADPVPRAIGRRVVRFRIVAWLCLCGGLAGMVFYAGEWLAERRVVTEGVAAEARVVGLTKLTKGRGDSTYKLTLSYDRENPPRGEPPTVRQEFEVGEATYRAARGDSPLVVHYLPEHPESARIAGMPSEQPWKIAAAAVVALLGGVLAWFAFRKRPTP